MKVNPFGINTIVSKEIFEKSIDITTDYSEIFLDSFLTESVLKEIPVVKSLVSFYNISNSISQRNKVRNIVVFFDELHKKNIDEIKLAKFKKKFEENDQFKNKVLETIILLSERFLQIKKAQILANLTAALIESNIAWEEFEDLTIVLDAIHPRGIDYLKEIMMKKTGNHLHLSLNQDKSASEAFITAAGLAMPHYEGRYRLTRLGNLFYEHGLKNAII